MRLSINAARRLAGHRSRAGSATARPGSTTVAAEPTAASTSW